MPSANIIIIIMELVVIIKQLPTISAAAMYYENYKVDICQGK